MPDLSHQGSAEYWAAYRDPIIYRVITFMESVESWTLDGHKSLEKALASLGESLEQIGSVDLNKLNESERFIKIVAQTKTGRGLRLLQALDSVHPGSASRILMFAEEQSINPESHAAFFLKRNIVFERLRLLSRTFADDRLKLVAQALEGEE